MTHPIHPADKAFINTTTLSGKMIALGQGRVLDVAAKFVGPDETGLVVLNHPFLPRTTLQAVTSQITMRIDGLPLRHLPIAMEHAKLWAACVLLESFAMTPVPSDATDTLPEALLEALADAEHDGWAHWQRYLHSRCIANPDGSLTIPADLVERWTRQINTPYADLSDAEQESDREQVRKIAPILLSWLR